VNRKSGSFVFTRSASTERGRLNILLPPKRNNNPSGTSLDTVPLLWCCPTIVRTQPQKLNQRQAHWLTELQEYHFMLHHVSGASNSRANLLSRRPGFDQGAKRLGTLRNQEECNGESIDSLYFFEGVDLCPIYG
jgi:hypothetical protein